MADIDAFHRLPSFYHTSSLMEELWTQYGKQYGEWVALITGMADFPNPYLVPEAYISNLASLVGLTIFKDENTDLKLDRELLTSVVSLYKMKGTYAALTAIAGLNGINTAISDLYCPGDEASYNNFSTYVRAAWFSGMFAGDNPPGIGSNYIKTPHFIFEILLNKVFGSGNSTYLFNATVARRISSLLVDNAPVHTVPHKTLLLSPVTQLDGTDVISDGNIHCAVTGDYSGDRIYLDELASVQVDDHSSKLVVATTDTIYNVVAKEALRFLDSAIPFNLDYAGATLSLERWVLGDAGASTLFMTDFFNVVPGTVSLNGRVPEYIQSGLTWDDDQGLFTVVDGILTMGTGPDYTSALVDLGFVASSFKYSVHLDNTSGECWSEFYFRAENTSIPLAIGLGLGRTGNVWQYVLHLPSGYGPDGPWVGGADGWHEVEITDHVGFISVIVDGVILFSNFYTALRITNTQVGFGRWAMVDSTTKYKNLEVKGYSIKNSVLSGDIDVVRAYQNYVEYEFTVSASVVQEGISEMGLYRTTDLSTQRVYSYFPPIDKLDGYELRVVTRVNS